MRRLPKVVPGTLKSPKGSPKGPERLSEGAQRQTKAIKFRSQTDAIHIYTTHNIMHMHLSLCVYISAGPSKRVPPGCEAAVQPNSQTVTFLSLKFKSYLPES